MKTISRIISSIFILSTLLPLYTVNAALPNPNPETTNLLTSYSSGVSGVSIGQGFQRILSNYPTLSLYVSLDAGVGNKISKIEFLKYGSPISTSITPSNTQTQIISTTFNGESKNVVSGIIGDENSTSKGYYSWYRYSSGVYWFADIPPTGQNSSNPSNCGSAISCFGDPGEYDNTNGTNFWAFPNVSSNQLTMSGTKEKSYVLEDSTSIPIPDQYVSNDPANFSASSSVNTGTDPFQGGFGEYGTPGTITGSPGTIMTDKSHFTVKFSKNFTSRSSYKGEFPAPGAAWMDWFFAFKTTLHSKTFVYPDQIRVTYAPVGVATLVVTPLSKTIQVGTTTDYIATYTDTAGVSTVVTNGSTWSINNTAIATINSTGKATGGNDGSVTVKAVYNGLTATAQLIVTRNALLVVTPYTDTVLVGGSTNYTATYTSTGGISSNVTNSSSWSTNNSTIATINSTGMATGKAVGSVIITAVYNGLTETAELNVIASATPAVTDAPATPTPTPAPPTCNTPPTVSLIASSSAKQGEDFYVSGFGSKQANGGTNLSYQWYYFPAPNGPVTTGPSIVSPTLNINTQGNYYIVLAVTDLDNPICSAQANKYVTITTPGPDADVKVQGVLKIKRPMALDGSSSSSPSMYPIVDSSRAFSITYPSGITASECVILDPLTGTKKVRIMCRKPGIYEVKYSVTNTLGLSSTKTISFTVADDLRPVGEIQSPTVIYRDPTNSNKVTVPLTLSFTSPDGDTIASTLFSAIYDENNDGFFVDDINNTLPTTFNVFTGAATVTGTKVGHIRNILSGCETFDAGDFASYLTTSDYLCSAGYLDVTVDNQAPTMAIGASKKFKADIYVNIGSVPTADQTYLLNNIQNLKANLGAKQVDANIIATKWDTNVEADFLKDSNSKLTSSTWRTNLDQKYFVGYTNSLTQEGSPSVPIDPLVLKTIPAYNTPINGNIGYAKLAPNGGRIAYIQYETPNIGGNYTSNLYIANNGTGYDAGVMGRTNLNANPPNSYGNFDFDTMGNYFIQTTYDTSSSGDPFRHNYSLSGSFGGTGVFSALLTGYNQYISKPSYINNEWTIKTTSGLFYINLWEQQQNYNRKASNGWNPTTSPDYCFCSSSSPDIYTEGYQVGTNVYWFGYLGYKSGDYFNTYLALHYNGGSAGYSAYSYTIYAKEILANGISIVVRKISDSKYYKLTFTNGALTSEIPYTNIDPSAQNIKFNLSTNKAYYYKQIGIDGQTRYVGAVYDLAKNTLLSSKVADAGIIIMDVGWDYDGVTPIYLFKTKLANNLYISKDNDPASGSTNIMQNVSSANKTVSYNTNGTYSWVESDIAFSYSNPYDQYNTYTNKGTVYKIKKVDSAGKLTYKAFSGSDGTVLFGNFTYADDAVVAFGVNAVTGIAFFALESEDYVPHNLTNINLGVNTRNPSYDTNNQILKDNQGNVFIKTVSKLYKFNRTTGTAVEIIGSPSSNSLDTAIYNGKGYSIQPFTNLYQGTNYYSWNIGGLAVINSYIPSTKNIYSYNSSSLDFDDNGYVAGALTTYDESGQLYTYLTTNRPDFSTLMDKSKTSFNVLKILPGYSSVRIKFFNNNLYLYARTSNATEIYQVTQATNSFKLTLTGYIQNSSVAVDGFTGNSNYAYGSDGQLGFTNDPIVKTMPKPTAFTVGANYNGLDSFLFKPKYYYDAQQPTVFDSKTNSFARVNVSYDYNVYESYLDGVFYNPTTNSYTKVRQINPLSSSSGVISNFSNEFAFGNSSFLYTMQNQVSNKTDSMTVWKMNRSGTSQLYTINNPNKTDSTQFLADIKAKQDDQGYTYILYSVGKSTQMGTSPNIYYVNTYTFYLVTNKSGTYVTKQLNLDPSYYAYANLSEIFINNGNLTFYSGNGGSYGSFYNIPLNNITSTPERIAVPTYNYPDYFKITNMIYDNGNVFAVGDYSIYRSGEGTSYYTAFINTLTPLIRIENAKAISVDDYSLYLTTGSTNTTNAQLFQFNKKSMALENSSPKGIGEGYPMKTRGKVMTFSYDGTNGSAKVVNAIDLGQGDPDFINTLGIKGIKPIFIGDSAAIGETVNPVITENDGYLIDYNMTAAQSLTTLTTTIVDDLKKLKQGAANGKIYFLKDDTVNMAGLYSDYESDPEQISKRSWNLLHDPSMFDNNQGTIATSGQNLPTTITVFDHVGKYTAKVKALDDPTYGNAALSPFAKWSTPTSLEFYIHRKPFAHFTYTLKDNPANTSQAVFSYMEDSYDLDHNVTLAATTKGIVKKTWRWKLASDLVWKDGLPPSNLAKNNDYVVSLVVTDLEGADSDPYTVTFNTGAVTPNTLPTAVIIAPTGITAATPTIYASQKPTYKWTYDDADGDPQQKYWLYVYDSSNNLVAQSNEVASNAVTFQQPSDLLEGVVYSVQVKVNDGYGYSALSAKKFFKIVTNRPPIGNISFVTPIYQNDTPLFTITQSDPDGDDLIIKVDSSFNGGGYSNVKQWASVASGSSRTFTLGPLAQGAYSLRLTLDDGKGGSYTQTYSFTVLPLFLNGAVMHTAIWESNRVQWNIKFPAKSRAADVFWAGEALELLATATDTGASLTKPQNVTATLIQTGDMVSLSGSDQIHFSGEMVNTNFIHLLKDGLYTMQFQIQWSNGMIQKTDVPFYIRGNILDVIVVQLRN